MVGCQCLLFALAPTIYLGSQTLNLALIFHSQHSEWCPGTPTLSKLQLSFRWFGGQEFWFPLSTIPYILFVFNESDYSSLVGLQFFLGFTIFEGIPCAWCILSLWFSFSWKHADISLLLQIVNCPRYGDFNKSIKNHSIITGRKSRGMTEREREREQSC